MTLTEIWQLYSERMTEIELSHRAVKYTADKELKQLSDYAQSLRDQKDLLEMSSSLHNMFFYDARTGTARHYNHSKISIEDRQLHILLLKNKQYLWLLAEAYEIFEDYLEDMYAYFGHQDKDFWPLQDYGNISLSELSGKDFQWHADLARRKKDIPNSILNRFRNKLPVLCRLENNNGLQVNLKLAMTLIEKLRHIIVHKGGKVDSKDNFIKLVAEQAGVYNNGNVLQVNLDLINSFFGEGMYSNLIAILEIRVRPEIPLNITVSLFGKLTNFLMAYAHLLYECAENHKLAGQG